MRRSPSAGRRGRGLSVAGALAGLATSWLAGCASTPAPDTAPHEPPATAAREVARDDRLAVVVPGLHDTLRSLARQWLGDDGLDWMLAELNGVDEARPGQPLVVPLRPLNPTGVHADRYQVVPVLCYHRFGSGRGRMVLAPDRFAAQMDWLASHGYRVLRLSELVDFTTGHRPLPERAVVLTFDDGYESVYDHAWPVLRAHGFPATVFLYTDFVGGSEALTWPQMAEMQASGLVDIQAHSKTHRNLVERPAGLSASAYRAELLTELRAPRELLEARLGRPVDAFAYPFGSADQAVVQEAERQHYLLGVTVTPGGNPFFAQPLVLRRTMVFGDDDLATFAARVRTSVPLRAEAR